jgi:hypothetical protein
MLRIIVELGLNFVVLHDLRTRGEKKVGEKGVL